MRTANAKRTVASAARVAGERATSWRGDNDDSSNINNNSDSNNNIQGDNDCRRCPNYLDFNAGQSTTPATKISETIEPPAAAGEATVGQQWTTTQTKASLDAKQNCKLTAGEPSELASSKKMAPPSPLSWVMSSSSSLSLSSTTTTTTTTAPTARRANFGGRSSRSNSRSRVGGNRSNCSVEIRSSSREAPTSAPSADQPEKSEEELEVEHEKEGGRSQIDRTMLVKKSVLQTHETTWLADLNQAGSQVCVKRNECDHSRREMTLSGVAFNCCLEKSNGHRGDQRKQDCNNHCLREDERPSRCERSSRKHEFRAQEEKEAITGNHHHHRSTTTATTIVTRALQGGQRKWSEAQVGQLEIQKQQQQCRINGSSSNDNQKCSAITKLAELVFIYIIITSSVAVVPSPASATHYQPLRSRALSQHQTHQHLQHLQQQQQQQLALQHPLVSVPTALEAPAITAVESSESEESSSLQAAATGESAGSLSPAKSARGQLMIGQHYNNFSSIVPYSIMQDSDADYNGGQAQEDQLLDELPESRQRQLLQMQQEQHLLGAAGSSSSNEANLLKSRALLPLDSSRLGLPQMQQIKSRFNQGCVGGTKCQFFAFCWMSGGSLGASCGLLMTCCVTPSRQEIQPGFYGPVVNDPYCGRSTSKINRIVGGTDASFGQFPWQAFVQVGGSRCGGALISSRHVVTAGHCVARSQHSPSSIKVTLGDYILNSDIESIPHEVFSVVEVLLHPNFRFTPQADRYDVAVLELERAASYKDNIKPICLPQKDAAFVGRVAYVAGWGALQAGSKLRPKVLQHVAVPVIENQVCESWHRRKGIDIRIYDEMMCAGYELGQRDACQGDSGGPLMLNQFGVWYLVGIVSAGYSCAKQYQPGIYHRVSSSSDWISSNVYQQQGANK